MAGVVIGTAANGERLRFENWVFTAWQHGSLRDQFLIASLQRCVSFSREFKHYEA